MSAWLARAGAWLPTLAMLALAWVFGRTLRAETTPLIERISRRAFASPSPRLCRYTRRLTAIWCGYFMACALVTVLRPPADGAGYGRLGAAVWLGSALLFVGEWVVRKPLFPEYRFPGLVQQLRDTWAEWRPDPAAVAVGGRSLHDA